jgi:hypothetical protein
MSFHVNNRTTGYDCQVTCHKKFLVLMIIGLFVPFFSRGRAIFQENKQQINAIKKQEKGR